MQNTNKHYAPPLNGSVQKNPSTVPIKLLKNKKETRREGTYKTEETQTQTNQKRTTGIWYMRFYLKLTILTQVM
jgi:hypothetical protein